jgi:2-polyprenyl-3-methyl-5-hydroxy-6-metoxy-1,4-benzoquinol methylase
MSKAKIFWDKRAAKFDKKDKSNSLWRKARFDAIREFLKEDDHLLDFGCASGGLSVELSKNVQSVHGIDISPKMIEIAEANCKELEVSNATFESGNLLDEQFSNQKYDKILAYYIIHLLEDPEVVLNRLHQLLSADGIVIAEIPCIGSTVKLKQGLIGLISKIRGLPFLHKFTTTELASLFEKFNFEILKTEDIAGKIPKGFVVAKKI